VPSRTALAVPTEVIIRLAQEKKICGVKLANNKDLDRVEVIKKNTPDDFIILSGDDEWTFNLMICVKADGVISIVSNIIPYQMHHFLTTMMLLVRSGESDSEARRCNNELQDLMKAMFIETNPIPIKTAMHMFHHGFEEIFRLPLCPMSVQNKDKLRIVLAKNGLF